MFNRQELDEKIQIESETSSEQLISDSDDFFSYDRSDEEYEQHE